MWLLSVLAVTHVKRMQTQLCYKHLITLTACGLKTLVDIGSDVLYLYVQNHSNNLRDEDNGTDVIHESSRLGNVNSLHNLFISITYTYVLLSIIYKLRFLNEKLFP